MNIAVKIANIHADRDDEIFAHLVSEFDRKLADKAWLLTYENYNRNDDNEIYYNLEIGKHYREFAAETERKWISDQLKSRLCAYYTKQGFAAKITNMDVLELYVDGNDLGEKGESDAA